MTVSIRPLLWLAAILLGVLPLVPDSEEPGTAAAWGQIAAWEDPQTDPRSLREHLTRPHATVSLLRSWDLPSGVIAPGARLLPPKKGGIPNTLSFLGKSPAHLPSRSLPTDSILGFGRAAKATLALDCTDRLARLDDGVGDKLTGAAGKDWFFATAGGRRRDTVTDRHPGERLTALTPIAPAPGPCQPLIDWNRDEDRHGDWYEDRRGKGGWVKDFVLDLGAHDPNREIQVVLADHALAYAPAKGHNGNGHGSRRHR